MDIEGQGGTGLDRDSGPGQGWDRSGQGGQGQCIDSIVNKVLPGHSEIYTIGWW